MEMVGLNDNQTGNRVLFPLSPNPKLRGGWSRSSFAARYNTLTPQCPDGKAKVEGACDGEDDIPDVHHSKLLDFPATRSPNIRPDGGTAKMRAATTEMKNWMVPRMNGTVRLCVGLPVIAM